MGYFDPPPGHGLKCRNLRLKALQPTTGCEGGYFDHPLVFPYRICFLGNLYTNGRQSFITLSFINFVLHKGSLYNDTSVVNVFRVTSYFYYLCLDMGFWKVISPKQWRRLNKLFFLCIHDTHMYWMVCTEWATIQVAAEAFEWNLHDAIGDYLAVPMLPLTFHSIPGPTRLTRTCFYTFELFVCGPSCSTLPPTPGGEDARDTTPSF